MMGFITKKTVFAHPILVYKLAGWRGLWAVIRARKGLTFLGILVAVGRI